MEPQDCAEQLFLADEYSRAVTDFTRRLEAIKRAPHKQTGTEWLAVENARARSQAAWETLEEHIAGHQCLALSRPMQDDAPGTSIDILGKAAAAALDAILVADDERRYIALNQAAVDMLGMDRGRILGRRVEEFFSSARGETIPAAWEAFTSEGVQVGICELSAPGRRRRFVYRAKANFAPGIHLSVLREIMPD